MTGASISIPASFGLESGPPPLSVQFRLAGPGSYVLRYRDGGVFFDIETPYPTVEIPNVVQRFARPVGPKHTSVIALLPTGARRAT